MTVAGLHPLTESPVKPTPDLPTAFAGALPSRVFERVFNGSPVGEYLLSPSDDPVILAVNDAFLRASGRTRESLVGQRLFAAFPGNPEDTDDTGVAALRASLARTIASRRPDPLPLQRYPIRVTRPDGSQAYEERYWHALNTPIFDDVGRLVCIAHRTEDVTAQTGVALALQRSSDRQAFQLALADRLRTLSSPDDIASASCAMLGQRLQVTRATWVEVDDAAGTLVQRHWVSGGAVQPATETRRLMEFGEEIIAALRSGTPLIIEDVCTDPRTAAHAAAYESIGVRSNLAIPLVKSGRLSLVLSVQHDQPRRWSEAEVELAQDVAERSWAAAENARAQEALREASLRKDEFLAMLAHELRNPLAPIRVAADLLARGALEPAQLARTSAVIARQARHMTALVDDLLDVSRVTRGLVSLDLSPQDMHTVVAHAMEQARPLIDRDGHQVTIEQPPEPALVDGDGKRLVQVVGNLLNNAAKYTPHGGRIRLTTEVDVDAIRVHVRDNGIGIAAELQPRIFELFTQAERSPDRSQGGLGLGLALVRSLVELHGGHVSVSSDGPGTGSCFTITLPRLASPPPLTPAEGAALPPLPPATQRLNVLVVDDNADAAEMLRLLLESRGHVVRVEHDPARALAAALAEPPQIGVIDIGLPGMDGYELVRQLRVHPPTAAALYLALTGYGQPADRRHALQAGFDEHLVKPADPLQLLALLERAPAAG
jgi:signal transduction histidine kinase